MESTNKEKFLSIILPGTHTTIYSKHPRFELLNPGGGEIFKKGSNVHIFWRGGPSDPQYVRLCLIDQTLNKVIATNLPDHYNSNSQLKSYMWTIPKIFRIDKTHNFLIYIEDIPRTTWTYGQVFRIA